MLLSSDQLTRAKAWTRLDPNETTTAHVQNLLEKAASADNEGTSELSNLFPNDPSKRINFGTAGLRSAMKPGPLNMNDLVVIQAAQGIAKYCLRENSLATTPSIVVGYDHRENASLNLSSLSFALFTVLVFRRAGFDVCLLDGFVFTPLVPFAMSRLANAAVGIMITASHNPKQDAGYKVYWNDGCQIRSPIDKGMAASILDNLEPWIDYRAELEFQRRNYPNDPCVGLSRRDLTQTMIDEYFTALQSSGLVTNQARYLQQGDWKPPSFAYTAMHGVAHQFAVQAFTTFGLPPFLSIPQQQEPDPNFPTVSFPNPEEKGALDLVKQFASENNCDIVLANDPDGDRLAVAERNRSTGEWIVFTGDEIGTMLGLWLFQNLNDAQDDRTMAMCASTVSSKMLATIAKVEGFYFEETLTGFKWIGSRAAELHRSGKYRSIFCYEEAIGFCCGDVIFDKDGISALCVMAELSLFVYRQGKTLSHHLSELSAKYGQFVSNNSYYFLPDPAVVPFIFADIQGARGWEELRSVGPYKVESVRFLGEPGYDSTTVDHRPTLPTSASSPMLTLRFTNGCVAQFRGSGTEPKLKYYLELAGAPGKSRLEVKDELSVMSEIILEILLQPTKYDLLAA